MRSLPTASWAFTRIDIDSYWPRSARFSLSLAPVKIFFPQITAEKCCVEPNSSCLSGWGSLWGSSYLRKWWGKCLRQCPVCLWRGLLSPGLVSPVLPSPCPACLTVAQLSVAAHGADSLVLSKCLTAAPLPCAACGLIPLDEPCQLRSNRAGMEKKTHRKRPGKKANI